MKSHTTKKAKILDEEQTSQFLTTAPDENRYWLVRKAVVIINLYGGLRGDEMRKIDRSNVNDLTHGFEITYKCSKGRKEVKTKT